MHARARELARLLLERGADPHDNQVLYNVFADNTSRQLLDDDIVWLLELMYEHSLRRGHKGDWDNPAWPMFDMGGAPSLGDEHRRHPGAHFMLSGAVNRNLLRLAEWMLRHGAGPNTPPGQLWRIPQRSLYDDAIRLGHHEMAELLARYGATRVTPRLDDHDRFVDACLRLDRERIREYLRSHPDALGDHRALFELVRRDRVDAVEMLLDAGVSPNVSDDNGITALHIASWGSERSAIVLIARGADVDARDTQHHSPPLGWASWAGNQRMIELLGRYSADVWYLTHAGRVDRLREVLREHPDLAMVVNDDGETPLMWLPGDEDAAVAIVTLFLDRGADASTRSAQGLTAADIARRRGMEAVADLLTHRA
jgi:ankyrin repeat protein